MCNLHVRVSPKCNIRDTSINAIQILGFPDSSFGKESACSAGDPGSIPGLGRSPGEGIGYPLPVAQLVKNLPAMQETWVQSLGWGDPLEKGKAAHSSILAWRIPWTVWSMGSQRVGHNWATFTSAMLNYYFMTLLAISSLLLEKYLFKLFAHFLIERFICLFIVVRIF